MTTPIVKTAFSPNNDIRIYTIGLYHYPEGKSIEFDVICAICLLTFLKISAASPNNGIESTQFITFSEMPSKCTRAVILL